MLAEVSGMSLFDMKLNAIAILPWFPGNHADLAREFDLSAALQSFTQDRALLLQLERIVDMLILATAATLEIGASRRNSRWRRLQHFEQAAAPQIVLYALRFRADHFARQDERRQNHFAFLASQPFAAVYQLFDG